MEEIDQGWQIIEGNRAILVVAGHNIRQGRKGFIKAADMGTGELVRSYCQKLGWWGLVSTRAQLDPNWYATSPFREKVKEIIKAKKIECKELIDNDQLTLAEDMKIPVVEVEIREDGRVKTVDPVKYEEAALLLTNLFTTLANEN